MLVFKITFDNYDFKFKVKTTITKNSFLHSKNKNKSHVKITLLQILD